MTSDKSYQKYASVIVDLSLNKLLDYGVPDHLLELAEKGKRVQIPVRGFLRYGYIHSLKDQPDFTPVLPIAGVTSSHALITDDLFELALWVSRYYCAPLQKVITKMLPPSVRHNHKQKMQKYVMRAKTREELKEHCKKIRNKSSKQAEVLDILLQTNKGILLSELLERANCTSSTIQLLCKNDFLKIENLQIDRSPLSDAEFFKTKPKKLNSEQAETLDSIVGNMNQDAFAVHLVHGVTGSGKTEVYLQAIDQALKQGKGAIMLVPEISLTAQTIERFRSRFEGDIAILHHRLSLGERLDEWERVRAGKARIVIGARSAVFSPVKQLGLIIVDEEHETSYKQTEETPCYHARDVAVMRGKMTSSTVILGSATPSLESYHNAKTGKYILNTLSKRADAASLPNVTIVDMQREYERAQGYTTFSDPLLNGIKKRLETGEQSLLFLNRRGYHSTLFCPTCRHVMQCPHCDVSLTFHYYDKILACHMCGYQLKPIPIQCPECGKGEPMKFKGIGTEQIERALHAIFPEVRTIRLDADTTRHKGSHEKLLRQFATGKADVLIGTQMIAKGLHFSEVTLVGVINSDGSLNIPDFRASESTFQLITQVAGRSGRGSISGEVIIQTCLPENRTLELASAQDYNTFYDEEISIRKLFHYPPFTRMVKLTFTGKDEARTKNFAETFYLELTKKLSKNFAFHPVLPAGHAKVKDQYRFQAIIRGPSIAPITQALIQLQEEIKLPSNVKLLIDVNPISTF